MSFYIEPQARIDRATEIALEQMERFESFKKYYRNPDSTTDQITAFLEQPFEAQHALLVLDHLVQAHKTLEERKNQNSKK